MERIMLFDIDKTIFDTKTSGEKLSKNIGLVCRKTSEEIKRINGEYKRGLDSTTDFNSDGFLKEVSKQTEANMEELNEALFNPDNFVLYPETLIILKKLQEKGYSLGTYSEGVLEWQMKKLTLTRIIDYFDPSLIFVERRKLSPETIAKIPNGVTLVDDKKEVIEKLKQVRPDLRLMWVNRKDKDKLETPQLTTIKTLGGLLKI